ncbi:MAG: arginine decarboxylase [Bacteroidia bacterium]
MKNKYIELISQTFEFPKSEFDVSTNGDLLYEGIELKSLAKKYGTPLRFTYLPKISENIQRARSWFKSAFDNHQYRGKYHYCYCTKSSHFSHVVEEAIRNEVHLETSSAFDLDIILQLFNQGKLSKKIYIICNGYKTKAYLDRIFSLIEMGFENILVILDNMKELEELNQRAKSKIKIGIRIASEEEPKFEFYTSRLGIGYKSIVPFYEEHISKMENIELNMLHFFINTGIRDTAYYWNELLKCTTVYTQLKKVCNELEHLNIGGGFPIKRSLNFDYDYEYMVKEIVGQIKNHCDQQNIPEPNIFTEFGSFTVGESGGVIYSILDQKQQNDRERWNMIDGSFMTTLPDSWAINERFIMLPLNRWNNKYERVLLGGLTCDSDDYYNSEQHVNAIYLPEIDPEDKLYICFFNTGAYQDSLSGDGGIKHCLLPAPKRIRISKDAHGNLQDELIAEEQNSNDMLKHLGYQIS